MTESSIEGQQEMDQLPGWVAPVGLVAVCLLAYGFWIPSLGLYWDDWYPIWAWETGGAARVVDGLASDRPLLGWLFAAATAIHAASPALLHLLLLALRAIGVVAAWWTVRALWPGRRAEALAVAFLMAVYPGFSQQSLPISYVGVFFTFACFFVSLGAMLWALRSPRRFWPLLGVALLTAVPAHWVAEYWLGLEILRLPLALWVIRPEWQTRGRRLRAVLVTVPFYVNVAVKLLWTVLVQESTLNPHDSLSHHIRAILASPAAELLDRLGYMVSDLGSAVVFAWSRAVQPGFDDMRLRFVVLATLLVLLAAGVAGFSMRTAGRADAADETGDRSSRWPVVAMAVGLGAFIVGMLPMWITDRHIDMTVQAFDRHSLSAMFGATILGVGFLRLLLKDRGSFILATAILVAAGTGFQFAHGHAFGREHERQADLLWQLHWRAPGLEPGTSLFLHPRPLAIPQSKDYTYAVPLNLAYDAGYEAGPVRYWVFPDAPGFEPFWLTLLSDGDASLRQEVHALGTGYGTPAGAEIERRVRNLVFAGSLDRVVVALHRPPGCLRVLDPRRDEVVDIPPAVREARLRSRPGLIRPDGRHDTAVLVRFYGPEPAHGWCWFYQKAELARQQGAWDEAARLADEVDRLGLAPADDREWSPFLEAYVRTGRYGDAERLVHGLFPYRGSLWDVHDRFARHAAFCDLLDRLGREGLLDPAVTDLGRSDLGPLRCPGGAS